MTESDYEWDSRKAAANLRKHGVSFEDARGVFEDSFAILEVDTSLGYDEERFIITGIVNDRVLSVVYIERGERTRIISARLATRRERHDDYQNQTPQ